RDPADANVRESRGPRRHLGLPEAALGEAPPPPPADAGHAAHRGDAGARHARRAPRRCPLFPGESGAHGGARGAPGARAIRPRRGARGARSPGAREVARALSELRPLAGPDYFRFTFAPWVAGPEAPRATPRAASTS